MKKIEGMGAFSNSLPLHLHFARSLAYKLKASVKIMDRIVETLTSTDEIWALLKYCESTENIIEVVKENTGREVKAEQAYEISCCLQQARAYYDAAQNAIDIVKPLFIFYGANSHAKAVILSKAVPKLLTNLTESHGLSTDWSDSTSIDSITIKVHKHGTFADLLNACGRSYFLLSDEKYLGVLKTTSASELEGHKFGLKSLASHIPELFDIFRLTYKEGHGVFPAETKCEVRGRAEGRHGHVGFTVRGDTTAIDKAALIALTEARGGRYDRREYVQPSESLWFTLRAPEIRDQFIELPIQLFNLTNGSPYLVMPYDEDKFLPEIAWHYMLAYLLGMLVRYRPELWMSVLNKRVTRCGDRPLGLIDRFIQICSVKFPLLALNEITGKIHIIETWSEIRTEILKELDKRMDPRRLTDIVDKELGARIRLRG